MNPEAILARGFSVVRPASGGAAIRDASAIAVGESIEIRFSRGAALASTLEVRK
jgi:exonuclease VII large subunit